MHGRFGVGGREYTIVRRYAAPSGRQGAAGPSSAEVLRAIAGDGEARHRLRRFFVEEGLDLTHADELDVLEHGLLSGEFVAHYGPPVHSERSAWRPPLTSQQLEELEVAPPPEHDWIEIELADEDGIPIRGAYFELTLPDGGMRHGRTDERGRFHIPRMDPGQCKIRWKRFHAVEKATQFLSAAAGE